MSLPPERLPARRTTQVATRALRLACAAALFAAPHAAAAQLCRPDSTAIAARIARPVSYVFFGRDHERVDDPAFLDHRGIAGAQLTFTWRELEPARDRYDFSGVEARLAQLQRHGKRLVVQVQDVSFADRPLVPDYLLRDTAFHGGAVHKLEGDSEATLKEAGWVARRWDPAVRARFAALLRAMGRAFDGRLEGINLPETAIGFNVPTRWPSGFTFDEYARAMQAITSDARAAFPRSCVIVYGNFMPGEWLPGNDKGFLRAVHAHAARIGAGVGGPDLIPHRPGQRNHAYRLIAARPPGTIAGVAVQDGNLAEKNPHTGAPVTVRELALYARDTLRLDFLFWGNEEPYYSRDVLPFLAGGARVPPQHDRAGGTARSLRPHTRH